MCAQFSFVPLFPSMWQVRCHVYSWLPLCKNISLPLPRDQIVFFLIFLIFGNKKSGKGPDLVKLEGAGILPDLNRVQHLPRSQNVHLSVVKKMCVTQVLM